MRWGGVTRHSRPAELENATDVKALDEINDKEEERSFIFVTDESPRIAEEINEVYETLSTSTLSHRESASLMSSGLGKAISGATDNMDYNSEVKEKIRNLLGRERISLFSTRSTVEDEERDFNVLFSGFTMKMTTKEAMKVRESVPEVKQIYIDYTYRRPEEKPSMYHSADMVKASAIWSQYDGTGRVVSVIDSGADITHPAMRVSDKSKVALSKEKVEELIKERLLKGQYLNDKFPYGYNFMDHNMDLKDTNEDLGMHGMHVSGTIGANADDAEAKLNGGIKIKGIAPEAQILVMRVFGQYKATTTTSAYIEAIEESIILGADSMNMSLGSMAGSEQGIDLGMQKALDNAMAAGSIIAIAGGNDFYSTSGEGNPRATNPDWGVMGSPGVAKSAFTVANYNNDYMITDASTFIIDEKGNEKEIVAKAMDTINEIAPTDFESMREYTIVDVGLGNTDEEYAGKEIKGNIVLAQRGGDTFANKIKRAQKAGAIAFLLGNNEADKPDYFIIMQTQTSGLIPGYSVTYRNYEIIKKNIEDAIKKGETPKIKINTKKHELDNPGKYQMNDSSSWGPNPTLRLKPEITAPGGEIYSTVNVDGGRYESMTGTSMATPHVAGGIALVNEFLLKNSISVNKEDKNQFIKNLMMATATPLLYKNNPNYYYSPRIQGAGLMNLEAAVNPNLVTVVDEGNRMSNGKAVVEFGSINDGKLDFTLKLNNTSTKDVTYNVRGIAQTDAVKDGKITFAPLTLAKEDNMGTVTVAAGGEETFTGTIEVNDNKVAAQLLAQPKGFFIDGFIFFDSQAATDGAKEFADLSVPFLAFYGDWANLPIIDVLPDEAFQYTADGTTWSSTVPFWYQGMKEDAFPGDGFNNWNFTHFFSRWDDGGRMIQGYQAWSNKYLDTYAISPNGDSRKDDLAFRGVFLRNADNFKIEYINEAEDVVRSIEEPYKSIITKSSYKGKFAEETVWVWRGENNDGAELPDGNYTVRVSAKAQDNDGTVQRKERTVYVDRVKPEIELIKAEKTGTVVDIEFKAIDDRSGLSWMDVFNMTNAEGKPDAAEFKYEEVPGEPNSLIVRAKWNVKEDFDFEAAKKNIWIGAMDMAGNYFERTLETIKNDGKVTFELKSSDPEDTSFPKELPRLEYTVIEKDEEGNDKEVKYNTADTNNLEYNTYRPYYPDAFPEYDVTFDPEEVVLTEDNNDQKVTVTFTKKPGVEDFGVLSVYVTNATDYAGEISLFAVSTDAEGKETWYKLPRKAGYARDAFEAKLPAGDYTIVAEGTGEKAPLLEIGNTPVTLKSREASEINTRVVFYGDWISFAIGTEKNTVDDVFGDDIVEYDVLDDKGNPKKDKDGNTITAEKIVNLQKYFDVIDTQTGKNIGATEAKVVGYYGEEGYQEFTLDIPVLSGTYKLVSKFDLNKYKVQNPVLELEGMYDNKQRQDKTKYMCLYPADLVTGSLKVNTEFVTKDEGAKPNVKYELYDSRDKLVEDWTNLLTGDYTLKTWVQDGYRPENESYDITIKIKSENDKTDTLNQEMTVRWFKLSEETRINPIVEFGLNGSYASEYADPVTVKLTNKETGVTVDPVVTVPVGKVEYRSIPAGDYKMEIELKEGWDYIFFTDIGSSGDKSQGNPDEVTLTEAYNYIEIRLIKKEKPVYDTKYKLVINEEGLNGVSARPKYALVDASDDTRYYTTERAEFINITPGKYKLYVDTEPTGFTASPKVIDVTIEESTDPAAADPIETTVTVNYKKSTNNIKINSVVVDKDGNIIDQPADPIAVQYEAYTEENGKKTFYDIGSLPVGVEVTVVPKNVKAPYELYEEDKNGIKVTVDETAEKEIKFRYVVSNERLNTKDLDEAIAEAKDMLEKAKLEPEYKKDLEEALKKAEDYLAGDDKTQQGVFDAANDLWDVIDAAVYMVTVTFDLGDGATKENKDIVKGTTVKKPADPSRSGYTFEGWFDGDTEFDFTTKIMQDITLKAKWNLIPTPTPTPIPEPGDDYIVPEKPERPHRPYRPLKPVEDKTDDKKDETVVLPREDKKDYGIVETKELLPVVLNDIPNTEAGTAIRSLVSRGILAGMGNGKFQGELPITRAMAAAVLMRISKDRNVSSNINFTDVKAGDWFNEAVEWAANKGLVVGYTDGSFKPNKLLTRQELAVILQKFLALHGINMNEVKAWTYKDLDKLPAWSKDAVIAMAKLGLIEGQTSTMYNPASEFTREELAVMLYKIIRWVETH